MAPAALLAIIGSLLAVCVAVILVMMVVVPLFKGIGWCLRQAGRFVVGEIGDGLRIVGAIITQVILLPLIVANVLIGRWSAAAHFGRAFQSEFRTTGLCLYRMGIGHPARLLCLTALTDGLEKRLPEVVAAAPTADRPSKRTTGQFEGYRIVGSLPGGGSGGKLYVAEPDTMKRAVFARNGREDVRQVVIKTFSLRDGSSLPQIVRESRALEAAKKLGLVLEHELCEDRFYYVTEYVPGESLGLVTQRLHAQSGGEGLGHAQLKTVLSVGSELLRTLETYHRGGLWHKDVKPDNIIVDGRAAHLVDFGLVTPLRSGMTLTTHGTEYFRDPELVRLALKGVKVHQVDGAKFDVYAAGAVLFSMVENSFPAHGGLSQISKRCPEALRWIVRRAMTDYDKRYPSAAAMMADLEVVRAAADPFAVKPIDLPSVRGAGEEVRAAAMEEEAPIRPAAAYVGVGEGSGAPGEGAEARRGSPEPAGGKPWAWSAGWKDGQFHFRRLGAEEARAPRGEGVEGRQRPRIRVNRWWSGGYVVDGAGERAERPGNADFGGGFESPLGGARRAAFVPPEMRRPAKEQLKSARERAAAARERAQARMTGRRKAARGDFSTMNAGVAIAVLLFVGACVAFVTLMVAMGGRGKNVRVVTNYGDEQTAALAYAVGDLPDVGVAAGADVPVGRGPRIEINGVTMPASAPVPPPLPPATMHGEKVLVITDVIPSTPAINTAIERLAAAGFEVLGNYPGNPAEEADVQEQLDLEVQAKQARGLGLLDAADTTERLSAWLADETDLSLLVWFARVDPQGGAVKYFVVSPRQDPGAGERDKSGARAALNAGMVALQGSPRASR